MQCRMTTLKVKKLVGGLLMTGLFLSLALLVSGSAQTPVTAPTPEDNIRPGELLIQLNPGADPEGVADGFTSVGMRAARLLSKRMNIWLYEYSPAGLKPTDHGAILARVREHGSVSLAQFNHVLTERATFPNDPSFSQQWALNNTGQTGGTPDADVDAPEAWDIATGGVTALGDQIVVAVVDGGCDLAHQDLNLFKNTEETPSNGIDDDGNGYIDDYDGWDAYANDGTVPSSSHGTHVSGIAAARGNNGVGVSGVNWGAKVMPVAGSSSSEATVVVAYGYVLEMRSRYNESNGLHGAFVVSTNSSFGVDYGQPANYPLWCAMYDSMGAQGMLSAAATANLNINIDVQGDIPTACPSPYMVAVTNTTNTDVRNSGAAYGATTIDLGAPGTSVYSTLPGNSYGNNTGTSMASPHVAGAVALMYAAACPTLIQAYKQNPGAIALVMKQYLLDGTDPNASLAGITVSGGRLNLHGAIQEVQTYPCGVGIMHTELPDTKDSINPYEVICTISADTTLIPDSLLLWYELASVWHSDTLTETGGLREYHGYIPPQLPGTTINYYLRAHAYNGKADTTEIFSFRVIDYAVQLTPATVSSPGMIAVDDTVWYSFSCLNDGIRLDAFNMIVANNDWPTTLWNDAGTTEISSTPTLAPNASYPFKARVIVGPSMYGDVDTALVVVKSQGNGAVQASSTVMTTSAGQPLTLPFADNFPSKTVNIGLWVSNVGASIDEMALNPPSPPYALRLNGAPSGADTIMSQAINLGGAASGVNISYCYEQTGGGDPPETGDDLFVEYLNDQSNWVLLNRHLGSDPDMAEFVKVTVPMPTDGYHSAFRIRLRNIATVGVYDDWFVDNIRIDYGPGIAVSPFAYDKSVGQGDSTTDRLIISSTGQGWLTYSLVVLPDFSPTMKLFDRLMQERRVNPATYAYPEGWNDYQEFKGDNTLRRGQEVVFNAGGPDAWGYIWIDSDEPGGPTYSWIDIEATGTDIASGLTDDNFLGPYPIGFTFPFYDSGYTDFYVGANGLVGLGPSANYGSLTNVALPNSLSSTPKNIICWCWDDLNILDADNPGGKVLYEVVDGNLVIQFERYPEYDGTVNPGDVITAEIILHPNGNIRLQYESIAPGFDILSNTVGIQNKAGTVGLTVSYNTGYLHNGLAVDFVKPAQWLTCDPAEGEVPPGQVDTVILTFSAVDLDTGLYKSTLKVYSNDPDSADNPLTIPARLTVLPPYLCGDATGEDAVDISDPVFLIAYIFSSGPAPDPLARGDANCDSIVDVSDAVYLIAYIFSSGPAPCEGCK